MNLLAEVPISDEQLVEDFRKGEKKAFDELVVRHKRWILSRAYRMSGNYQEAEDWAQDVFIKVYRHIDRYHGNAPFIHWLSKLSTRVFLDALRWRKARQWLQFLPKESMPEEEMIPEESEAVKQLREAMRLLLPMDAILITLLELEDRSIEEVAEMLAISKGNVKTRAFRARKKLEAILLKQNENTRFRSSYLTSKS
jgi:RNA polymerase sigma-70 factor (ECF subfamily)